MKDFNKIARYIMLAVCLLLIPALYFSGDALRGKSNTAEDAGPDKKSIEAQHAREREEAAAASENAVTPAPDAAIEETNIVSMDKILYTYEEMEEDIKELTDKYADYIEASAMAETADGRNVYLLKVGNPDAPHKILIQAGLHAREYVNCKIVMKQIEELVANASWKYRNGRSYQELMDQVCFCIIPMANPDGTTIAQTGTDDIRKEEIKQLLVDIYENDVSLGRDASSDGDWDAYFNRWKANALGVDLNKNFDVRWDEVASYEERSMMYYKGTEAASEVETNCIVIAAAENNVEAVISYHSAGNIIYWEDAGNDISADEASLAYVVADLMGYADSFDHASQTPGGCSNYFNEVLQIPAITIENGTSGGDDQFPLDDSELENIWFSNQYLLPELACYFAGYSKLAGPADSAALLAQKEKEHKDGIYKVATQTGGGLAVYKEPSRDSQKLDSLSNGSEVTVIALPEEDSMYCAIDYYGDTAYVMYSMLE